MFGAAIGDIVGSRFEFANIKTKEFEFWHDECFCTDDTVCTVAVADILLNGGDPAMTMQRWCREYPDCSYGVMFAQWIESDPPQPYNSYGNGSAMRVSPAALFHHDDLNAALRAAERVTEITHNHADGIKGALATTHAIHLALNGATAEMIRASVEKEYDYDLSQSVDDIRAWYEFDVTAEGTVPPALVCALEAEDFEDAIRNAISIGGDSDTIAAIAGALSEALHGIAPTFIEKARSDYLSPDMDITLTALYERVNWMTVKNSSLEATTPPL